MKHLTIVFLFLSSFLFIAKSQPITNVQAKQEGTTVIITYFLQSDYPSIISLYYRQEGDIYFNGPLKSVSGDIGEGILPGNKTITWNTLMDQEMLIGDKITFKVVRSNFGLLTDSRDGKTYKTIQIGSQVIMAENLSYKPDNGSFWAYNDDPNNLAKYGYLYNWETAKNVCPKGWHLPGDTEWTTLSNFLGGEKTAGRKLKESGTANWNKPNTDATNETRFTALPGGARSSDGTFINIGSKGFWWSSSVYGSESSWNRGLSNNSGNVIRASGNETEGFSVRCFKD